MGDTVLRSFCTCLCIFCPKSSLLLIGLAQVCLSWMGSSSLRTSIHLLTSSILSSTALVSSLRVKEVSSRKLFQSEILIKLRSNLRKTLILNTGILIKLSLLTFQFRNLLIIIKISIYFTSEGVSENILENMIVFILRSVCLLP